MLLPETFRANYADIVERKKKERKDYTFRRQSNEKPSIIPGCPGAQSTQKARTLYHRHTLYMYTKAVASSKSKL